MTDPKERVLLVDDEEAIRAILNKGLALRGFECEEAENGEQALEHLERRQSDLVIMDICIQGERDGIEVADLIRRRFDVPVVYMTAFADDETLAALAELRRVAGSQLDARYVETFADVLMSAHIALRDDEAFDLVVDVARGAVDAPAIAMRLRVVAG